MKQFAFEYEPRPHFDSFVDGQRFSRPRSLDEYERWLNAHETDDGMDDQLVESALVRHDWLMDALMVRVYT